MKRLFETLLAAGAPLAEIKQKLLAEAHAMYEEDIAACKTMGAFGAALMPQEGGVLTHCNAGALATCGYGTALGVIRSAVEQGKRIHVYADETRPFLQGARLTAWELQREGIDQTLISDNMAGLWLLVPVLLLWLSRLWLKASRGELEEDPVVYAITDRRSLQLGVVVVAIVLSAL